jgi:hypothetical protein
MQTSNTEINNRKEYRMDYVEEVKAIIRISSGARDFISKANWAGYRSVKEDFIGLHLQKGDCTVILTVLASRGPDTIWCLSMASKGSPTVHLINEGKVTFDEGHERHSPKRSKYITDKQNRTFYLEQGRRVYLDGKPDVGAKVPAAPYYAEDDDDDDDDDD